MNRCSITPVNGGLRLRTPYDPSLVAALKANVPATDRKFDPASKVWIVSPKYAQTLQNLIEMHFGEFIMLPQMTVKAVTEIRMLEVKYLGQCKVRDSGEITAFGWMNGQWSVIFPEDILRTWFETGPAPTQQPDKADTLYAILGVAKTATGEEIKTAFRRMARQWHPDVCHEPNAHEMFLRVREASDILSNPKIRARYDAGLALEATLNKQVDAQYYAAVQNSGSYRAPLRCGWIMAEGVETIGRFVVSRIIAWEDIVRGDQVLVTSWPMGVDRPVEQWA